MHSYKCSLYCANLSVSDLEQAEICEKYNVPKTKELIKWVVIGAIAMWAVLCHMPAMHTVFESQLQAYLFINDVIGD